MKVTIRYLDEFKRRVKEIWNLHKYLFKQENVFITYY